MKDLLWLVNHPLRGNVAGTSTSRNPNTPGELERRLSIRICRILPKLPHSIEPKLGNLHWTWMDSSRASALKLLRGLPTSWEVLWPSEPHLSLSTLQEWTWEHYRGLNLTLFTLSTGGSTMVFIGGVRWCCGQRLGVWGPLVRSANHATWLGGQVSSLHYLWAFDTLSTTSAGHIDKTAFGNAPTHGRLATPWLSWARALCHIIPSCHIVSDYALFWT
jgi:hypothetical protein